jgi:hypothetical protein
MAESNELSFNIKVGGNAEQSIGNVKKALKEANAELINAQANFGDYSKEAIAAAKRVAELKDKISEARETADLFDPGKKFQVFAGAINAVAGGFSAVQGALGIVGAESEELQKSLLKVQSALALSQGLSAITDSAKDFQRLATVVKTNVVGAFSTLRGAIIATGLGALAVVIGLVIANFDKVKQAVLNMFPGLGKLASFIGNTINAFTDLIGVTNAATRAEQQRQAVYNKAAAGTKVVNEGIDRQIKLLQAQGAEQGKIDALKKQSIQNELNDLKKAANERGLLFGEQSKKYKDLQNDLKIIDATAQKAREDAAKQAATKSATAGNKYAEDTKKKAAADAQERLDAEKAALEKLSELRNQLFLSTFKNENDKKKAELNLAFIKEKDEILANTKITEDTRNQLIVAARTKLNTDLDALALAEKEKQATADAKLLEDSAVKMQKEDEDEFAAVQKEIAANNKKNEKIKADNEAFRKAELEADISLQNAKFDAVSAGLNLLSSLAGQNEKIANAIFVIDKALAIAKIVVDTQREIAGYYAANAAFGLAGAAIATKQSLVAKIRAGIGIASIAGTTISKFKGGGSAGGAGGGAGGSAPSVSAQAPIAPPQPQAQTTSLNTQTINALGNQAQRAYVVESDVTSNQQRIAAIQQRARFG